MIDLTNIGKEIAQVTSAHSSAGLVVAVYVFGSAVGFNFKESSDIDLAFLVDEGHYKEDPFRTIGPAHKIGATAGLMLRREIDVVILNSASLEMAYEIVTTGIPVFESDHELRLQYEIKIKGMYFDFRPFLSELRERKLAKLGSLEVSG